MEHLRRAIRIYEVIVTAEEFVREHVSNSMVVIRCEGASVDDIGVTGIHPCMLVKSLRSQIKNQPMLYISDLVQRKLAILVRVDQLAGLDRLA
jgi:hypothetical protein